MTKLTSKERGKKLVAKIVCTNHRRPKGATPVKHDYNPVLKWIQRFTGLRKLSASLVVNLLKRARYIVIFVLTGIMGTAQTQKEPLFFYINIIFSKLRPTFNCCAI
jgi:hypothetical protein